MSPLVSLFAAPGSLGVNFAGTVSLKSRVKERRRSVASATLEIEILSQVANEGKLFRLALCSTNNTNDRKYEDSKIYEL